MRPLLLPIVLLVMSETAARADLLHISMEGRSVSFSDSGDIDYLRTHIVYVFDMAAHHCQPDSDSHWKPGQKEIADMIEKVKDGNYLELEFARPTPITVEERDFAMKRMWVSIRAEDWATFHWAFQTPEGQFVALSRIEGTFNRKLGPMIQSLLNDSGGLAGEEEVASDTSTAPD